MNTSKTVQAAQRLLAERERFGLAKYGTTVDRTDLQAGDWLQHAIEEASDLLLYLIRLQQMILRTPDSERPTLSSLAGIAPDLMPLEDQPAPAAAPEDAERRFGPITSDPADAERNIRAKECPPALLSALLGSTPQPVEFGPVPDPSRDPVAEGFRRKADRGHVTHPGAATEGDLLALQQWMLAWKSGDSHPGFEEWRAAYEARWKDAPEWADELVQSVSGTCRWGRETPAGWVNQYAGQNILGSVKCEPRPVQGVEGERRREVPARHA